MKHSHIFTLSHFYILALLFSIEGSSQFVPVHTDYNDIYSFVDELANDGIIDVASVCKPYSRMQILAWLIETQAKSELLNKRQKKEVEFYLLQFRVHNTGFSSNPIAFSHSDSLFSLRIEPLWGVRQYISDNKQLTHFWGGGSAFAYLNKGWSFYANVRDNHMTGHSLTKESYFSQIIGGNVKTDRNFEGSDFSEMRGGINYTFKWGNLGLVKDHVQWGDNYNGALIFSGRSPSFPMIRLQINPIAWLQFNYYHGWLVSEVIDSTQSYMSNKNYRAAFRKKFIASNFFSFRLMKATWVSFGNSIVYSDMDAHPAYLLPFMFYKSIDHTVNWGIDNQNSQMFMNISSRRIKHLHLYGSFYIDEWSNSRVNDPYRTNFTSQKAGFKLSNWPLKNLSATGEYTQSTPVTYKHRVNTLTFESNGYNLGWFMRDNSQNFFASLEYKPIRTFNISIYFDHSRHGNEYAYKTGNEDSLPVRNKISWDSRQLGLRMRYQWVNNLYLTADIFSNNTTGYPIDGNTAQYYLEMYSPPIYRGNKYMILLGFNMGF